MLSKLQFSFCSIQAYRYSTIFKCSFVLFTTTLNETVMVSLNINNIPFTFTFPSAHELLLRLAHVIPLMCTIYIQICSSDSTTSLYWLLSLSIVYFHNVTTKITIYIWLYLKIIITLKALTAFTRGHLRTV